MPKEQKQQPLREVLIVAKQNKTGLKMAVKLERMLRPYVRSMHFDRSTGLRLRKRGISIKRFEGDLIITVGGDGTLLWTAHQAKVPILAVKIEGHGFLCNCTFKELEQNISRLLKGDYMITEKMRLNCYRETKGILDRFLSKPYPPALNEIVFGRKRPSKILKMEFKIDGTPIVFSGDGLLISTPAGSTAYNASAGGPIIDPELRAISIVPINTFFSKVMPKVVPADKKIEITVLSGECSVIVDGHGGDYVKAKDKFVVETGRPLQLASLTEHKFYDKLKAEFLE